MNRYVDCNEDLVKVFLDVVEKANLKKQVKEPYSYPIVQENIWIVDVKQFLNQKYQPTFANTAHQIA